MKHKRQDTDEDKDAVGYCSPPRHSQFRPGTSGNPKGRPKAATGLAACLRRELEAQITVREGNRQFKISKETALAKLLVSKGLGGDLSALRLLASLSSADAVSSASASAVVDEARQGPAQEQLDREVLDWFRKSVATDAGSDVDPDAGTS